MSLLLSNTINGSLLPHMLNTGIQSSNFLTLTSIYNIFPITILLHVLHVLAKFTVLLSCCHFNRKCHLYINISIIPTLQILSQTHCLHKAANSLQVEMALGGGTLGNLVPGSGSTSWYLLSSWGYYLISAAQFPLQNENNNMYFIELLWGLTEILHVKHFEWMPGAWKT